MGRLGERLTIVITYNNMIISLLMMLAPAGIILAL